MNLKGVWQGEQGIDGDNRNSSKSGFGLAEDSGQSPFGRQNGEAAELCVGGAGIDRDYRGAGALRRHDSGLAAGAQHAGNESGASAANLSP